MAVEKRSLAKLVCRWEIKAMFRSRETGVSAERLVVVGLSIGYVRNIERRVLIGQKLNTVWTEDHAIPWIRKANAGEEPQHRIEIPDRGY